MPQRRHPRSEVQLASCRARAPRRRSPAARPSRARPGWRRWASCRRGAAGSGRRRRRVAIVGAGAGGVAAAYFLSGTFDVDVFEARSRIGGHCDSRVMQHRGRRITVDLGAQFFHPDTHPIYVTLLEELGLYDPEHPDADATVQAPGEPVHLPDGRWRARLLVGGSARDAVARGRLRAVHAARAAGGAVRPAVGDDRRRVDPRPAVAAGVQGRRPVPVDHGDDRVRTARRAADVGAVDPADVRARVPGRRPPARQHVHLGARPAGEPAADAGPQPDRPGAPPDAGAGAVSHPRRLVRADPGRAGRARTGTWCSTRRRASGASCCARCPPSPT